MTSVIYAALVRGEGGKAGENRGLPVRLLL